MPEPWRETTRPLARKRSRASTTVDLPTCIKSESSRIGGSLEPWGRPPWLIATVS
jgi:hypothetical protein